MKNYKIKSHTKELADGEVVREVLTLEVSYENGSLSEHGVEIPIGADIQDEALKFAAELEQVLEEPKEITVEEVEISEKEQVLDSLEVSAKVSELQSLSVRDDK